MKRVSYNLDRLPLPGICAGCGAALPAQESTKGRPRVTCSDRCRQRAHRFAIARFKETLRKAKGRL